MSEAAYMTELLSDFFLLFLLGAIVCGGIGILIAFFSAVASPDDNHGAGRLAIVIAIVALALVGMAILETLFNLGRMYFVGI